MTHPNRTKHSTFFVADLEGTIIALNEAPPIESICNLLFSKMAKLMQHSGKISGQICSLVVKKKATFPYEKNGDKDERSEVNMYNKVYICIYNKDGSHFLEKEKKSNVCP